MSDNPSMTLSGKVEKIIPADPTLGEPEKAQISVEQADHLYKEIRVENVLVNDNGQTVALKKGANVNVTIEAEADATAQPKPLSRK